MIEMQMLASLFQEEAVALFQEVTVILKVAST